MKRLFAILTMCMTAVCLSAPSASAVLVTQWNFNSVPPDSDVATGSTLPSIGFGTASLLGATATFGSGDAGTGSSDPATGDDSGWNTTGYASQGTGNKTRGVQFNVSTLGWKDVVVSFDQRLSNTAANTWRFQYSTDGSNFIDSTQFTFTPAPTGTGDTWYNNRTVNLTGVSGVENNANFAFRIVAEFAPSTSGYVAARSTSSYGTTGTSRFDMVSVSAAAVPEPTSMLLAAIASSAGGIAALRRKRKTTEATEVVA